MKRKIAALWLSFAMVVGIVVIVVEVSEPARGAVLYVGGGGPGNYSTIQAGISAAFVGDTVYVYKGTYFENIMITKAINLKGEDRNTTIIDGSWAGSVVTMYSDFANVTGFTITNGTRGIYLEYASNNRIINNNFYNSSFGIDIKDSPNNYVLYNNISQNWYGIWSISSNNCTISFNNISSNDICGLILVSTKNNTIQYNNMSYNGAVGLHIEDSENNTITDNNITHNDNGGIYLKEVQNCTLQRNTFHHDGVYIYGKQLTQYSTHTITEDNTVNGKPLYYYKNYDGVDFDGTPVGELILVNCTNVNVQNLQIVHTDIGIELAYSSHINIINNNLSCNNRGLYVYESSNNNITNNSVFTYHQETRYEGITLIRSDFNNITDNFILNNKRGIRLHTSSYNNIVNNNCSMNRYNGIDLTESSNITLIGNKIYNNQWGIDCYRTQNVTISDNQVSNNLWEGIEIHDSSNVLINNNTVSHSDEVGVVIWDSTECNISNNSLFRNGFFIHGHQLEEWDSHTLDDRNTVNGKPAYYWKHKAGAVIPPDAGQVILVKCSDIVVKDQEFIDCSAGVELAYCDNTTITGVNASSSGMYGFYIEDSPRTKIINNTIAFNNWSGLDIYDSSNLTISNNNIHDNFDYSVYIENTTGTSITGNNIENNYGGPIIRLLINGTINSNNISSNGFRGMYISNSHWNDISCNSFISNHGYGINMDWSSNNTLFHNNFINNTVQALDKHPDNQWDSGYPGGGNYWSDYNGSDIFKGQNQDIIGSDGIGDTNYSFNFTHDNYPLMKPYICKPIENCTTLNQGWNLISLPLMQIEQNLISVLGSIDGCYDAVQWHNSSDSNDPWKHHKVGKPVGNDLFNINESIGFWVHITNPGDTIFLYNGTKPISNQTITLYKGWNMVGYPSLSPKNRTTALNNLEFGTEVDAIWSYNAAALKWEEIGEFDSFFLGKGYWIHATTDCVWEVPL